MPISTAASLVSYQATTGGAPWLVGAQEHHNRGSSFWPTVHAESRSYGPISGPASNAPRVNTQRGIIVIVLLLLDASRGRHAATSNESQTQ